MSQPDAITFQCGCGRAMRAKAEHAGKTARCPSCQQSVKIPGGNVAPVESDSMFAAPPPLPGQADPFASPFGHLPMNQPGMQAAPGPYQQPGYQQPGYQQPGYQQAGYQQPGYQQPGMQPYGAPGPGGMPPSYQQPASGVANETCPGCGSFLPMAQQTCHKCRFDRAAGRILPYQNMMQPTARPAAPAYQPTAKKSSVFVDSKIQWGTIGSGFGVIFLGAVWLVGGLMFGVLFFYPIAMFVIGTIMIFKGIVGSG